MMATADVSTGELPTFFEDMVVLYDCSAVVNAHNGSVAFNMTGQCSYTVIELDENASIQQVFNITSMNGELPQEVVNVYFPFQLEPHTTTLEVPAENSESHYWAVFLDEGLFARYKERGRFIGEESFDAQFGTVGTYHIRKVGAYSTYDVFYDKATGWVVFLKETYGGGQIPNFTVTYVIEVAETNASFSPPIPSQLPDSHLAILAITMITIVAASVFFIFRKRRARKTEGLR